VVQKLELLDTTLRDGSQATGVSLTVEDKVKIALLLDELGIDYIEGGWPGSNPKDVEFFKVIKDYNLRYAKVAAFGSTRRKDSKVDQDKNVETILEAGVDVAVIFGKSWVLHVDQILRVTKEENLEMIYDTINYLKSHGLKVIFDAEHFYQGFKEDPEYALQVLKVAEEAGASTVVLCDTNGGALPWEVYEITKKVVSLSRAIVGVHMHNDIGCAVANTLMGVLAGARHVQGTINGVGERTGNADLIQVIPTLYYKMGFSVLKGSDSIKMLKKISTLVYEILSLDQNPYQPYVGEYAFAHKAGVHVDAVLKNPKAYEHIDPELVGNTREIVVSDLSGSANLVVKLRELGIDVSKRDTRIRNALSKIKKLGKDGYNFDLAPELAVLIVLKELGYVDDELVLKNWKVTVDRGMIVAEVQINGTKSVAEGEDFVVTIFKAISDAISTLYPWLPIPKITSSSVTMLNNGLYRVTITLNALGIKFSIQEVSRNIFDAFTKCFVNAYEYLITINKIKSDTIKMYIDNNPGFMKEVIIK
jgi:2-isopropylmalate synthase